MFERFTERARQVVVLAQEEARDLGHDSIGSEHLLLGLLREQEGVAAVVLQRMTITADRVRAHGGTQVPGRAEPRGKGDARQIPFTPRAKAVLELALREALSLGHNYIGTEHVLLAIVRGDECTAARILLELDAGPEKIRTEVIRELSAGSGSGETHGRPSWQTDVTAALEAILERLEGSRTLLPRRQARRLVQDALRRQDPEAQERLGPRAWARMVEEILDANPDVEPA